MKAMLFCRISRVVGAPIFGRIPLWSRPSSAACSRARNAAIGARHDWSAGLSMCGPAITGRTIVAVADRLQQLIDDGHGGRLERRHAGPIQDQAPAGAREQRQDDGMLGKDVVS